VKSYYKIWRKSVHLVWDCLMQNYGRTYVMKLSFVFRDFLEMFLRILENSNWLLLEAVKCYCLQYRFSRIVFSCCCHVKYF